MRKTAFVALVSALALLLCACGGTSDAISYADPTHAHVFGHWYDLVPVTCMQKGSQVRYCKLCHAEQTVTVEIPEAEIDRLHAFEDAVTPPTEKDWGYTDRTCTHCGYTLMHTAQTPPLYALLESESTVRKSPDGVSALLLSDTKTHTVSRLYAADTEITADLGRRLAVALTAKERMNDMDATLLVSEEVLSGISPTTQGVYVGATLTARQLLGLWLDEGGEDVLRCICTLLGESRETLLDAVIARMERLGVEFSAPSEGVFSLSVYEMGVLIARVLDDRLLATLLSENTNPHLVLCGHRPTVYFESAGVRITAIPRDEGYAFLILVGDVLHGSLEQTLYGN